MSLASVPQESVQSSTDVRSTTGSRGVVSGPTLIGFTRDWPASGVSTLVRLPCDFRQSVSCPSTNSMASVDELTLIVPLGVVDTDQQHGDEQGNSEVAAGGPSRGGSGSAIWRATTVSWHNHAGYRAPPRAVMQGHLHACMHVQMHHGGVAGCGRVAFVERRGINGTEGPAGGDRLRGEAGKPGGQRCRRGRRRRRSCGSCTLDGPELPDGTNGSGGCRVKITRRGWGV